MKLWRSIEFRLTAWYAAALFAGFVALGVSLWTAVGRSVRDAIDDQLLQPLGSSVAKIEQFSADASPELRTPISVIRTTAELALRDGRTVEGFRSRLEDIEAR